jgi:spore coat polysaccharide biosynthesis protein SpsF
MPKETQPHLGIVLQARLTSRRLPGKVLAEICGQSLLAHLIGSCRKVRGVDGLCVATSNQATDDAIVLHCRELGVECYRGDLNDVAARFLGAAATHRLDAIVRLSADSPLMLPSIIEDVVEAYRREPACNLATNVLRRTYPSGLSVEVIDTSTLARTYPLMDSMQREHVTSHFYVSPAQYRVVSVEREPPLNGYKFSIDTPQDLEQVGAILEQLDRPHWQYTVEQLVEVADSVRTCKVAR